jgi:hypothetical protein
VPPWWPGLTLLALGKNPISRPGFDPLLTSETTRTRLSPARGIREAQSAPALQVSFRWDDGGETAEVKASDKD